MIAVAGYYDFKKGMTSGLDLNAVANLKRGTNNKPGRTFYFPLFVLVPKYVDGEQT